MKKLLHWLAGSIFFPGVKFFSAPVDELWKLQLSSTHEKLLLRRGTKYSYFSLEKCFFYWLCSMFTQCLKGAVTSRFETQSYLGWVSWIQSWLWFESQVSDAACECMKNLCSTSNWQGAASTKASSVLQVQGWGFTEHPPASPASLAHCWLCARAECRENWPKTWEGPQKKKGTHEELREEPDSRFLAKWWLQSCTASIFVCFVCYCDSLPTLLSLVFFFKKNISPVQI